MRHRSSKSVLWGCAVAGLLLMASPSEAGSAPDLGVRIAATTAPQIQQWDATIATMLRNGDLQLTRTEPDALLPGRSHERFAQVRRGVPVWGGGLVRQRDAMQQTVSVFGHVYQGIEIGTTPQLSAAEARKVVERLTGATLGREPRLVVLPRPEGGYALSYEVRALAHGDLRVYFVDAMDGSIDFDYSDLETVGDVGLGTGVLGDKKKVSAHQVTGGYEAQDDLRPPTILTFDLNGDLGRTIGFLNGAIGLGEGDLARDSDNTWTDGPNVDAHVYAGYTYDYYFKRFGRRGLDNANLPMLSIVHPVHRDDIFGYLNSPDVIGLFYLNAFYAGGGVMVYGEGLPDSLRLVNGQSVNYFAAALDVVAHELTHGVTDFTSRLIYLNESGALNEAFSDIMGTSVEFFFQPPGNGLLKADYLVGEDIFTPGGLRSMANPLAFGDPDNYSVRYTGGEDNGGVHTNSGIANQAYYLAIEGGRNRTSGISVTGVGGANREQIEKVFYRAFTEMLPRSADFATARAATIQAATDLYGDGSAPERAVRDAWTAVGVN